MRGTIAQLYSTMFLKRSWPEIHHQNMWVFFCLSGCNSRKIWPRLDRRPLVAQTVKRLPTIQVDPGQEDPLEKEMATHSSILAWRIHGWRSLVGNSPWSHKESDTTERLHFRLDRLIYWKTRLSKLFNHTMPSFNFQYYSIVAWSSLVEERKIIIQLLMQLLMPGT